MREQGVVTLHLPIGLLKTCEMRTQYLQSISQMTEPQCHWDLCDLEISGFEGLLQQLYTP